MIRLAAVAVVAGLVLTYALAWSMREEVAYAAEPVQAPQRETMAEVIGAVVESCIRSGGTWSSGVEDGVVIGRCHPLPNVGVVPVVRRRAGR